MIYVRDDDVLIDSSSHEKPFEHFKTVHYWICESNRLLHVPTILINNVVKDGTKGIVGFPEAVEFIKSETVAGRMRPQIHGLEHIDYGKLSEDDVRSHLKICREFMWYYFDVVATAWYTPWGASQPHLWSAANKEGLELVDCSRINKLAGRHGVVQRLRDGHKPEDFLEEDEIFFHWWEGGLRLKRVVEVLKHGSWKAAEEANGKWFSE